MKRSVDSAALSLLFLSTAPTSEGVPDDLYGKRVGVAGGFKLTQAGLNIEDIHVLSGDEVAAHH
ncbi:Uncharacterised protein [Achromobacter sp. 2789STDY5608633]|nr:Uncharacterised protein [Achromobacter sp. 2789STDY5608633]